MKYIDIHCHLDFKDYDSDKEEVFARMKEKEIGAITIGCDLESSKRAVEIAEENENVWACVGVHPADNHEEIWDEQEFEKLVKSKKVVAIGECGLDFFRTKDPERQVPLFHQQIEFALKHNLPLMLHCRNAYDEVLDILEEYKKTEGDKLRGDVHFFAGNVAQAQRFLDIGFSMSFTGVITFPPKADQPGADTLEVIKYLPLESIMSETDAPFASPTPYRGKRNEPAYVVEVVKKLAELKGVREEEMAQKTIENARRLFGLKN